MRIKHLSCLHETGTQCHPLQPRDTSPPLSHPRTRAREAGVPPDVWDRKIPAALKGHQNCNNPSLHKNRNASSSQHQNSRAVVNPWVLMGAVAVSFVLAPVSFTFSCHTMLPGTVHSADSSSTWRAKYITLITNLKKWTGFCCWFIVSFLI